MKKLAKIKDDRGAIIIESIIALTVYIFAIFTILSIVDICYTQARISIALNSAARDLSKYSYLYYKINADDFMADLDAAAGDSKSMTLNIINGSGVLINSLTGLGEVEDEESLQAQIDEIDNSADALNGHFTTMADAYAKDPAGFIKAMGMMTLSEAGKEGGNYIGQAMGRAFMKKNLKAFEDDDPDAFLKRHGVEDGLDGLSFEGTSMMVKGEGDNSDREIILSVTYEIKVLELLDVDYSFRIWQTAKTYAWGKGVDNEKPAETQTE